MGCLPLQRVRTVPAVWRRHVLTIVVSWKRPCCRFPETGRSVRPVRRRNGVPAARSKRAAPPRSCLPRRHRARECSGRGPGTLPGRGSPDKWPLLVRPAVDGNRLSLLRGGRKPRSPCRGRPPGTATPRGWRSGRADAMSRALPPSPPLDMAVGHTERGALYLTIRSRGALIKKNHSISQRNFLQICWMLTFWMSENVRQNVALE